MLESQYQNELYHQEPGSVLFESSNKMYCDIYDEFLVEMASQSEKKKLKFFIETINPKMKNHKFYIRQ